MQPENHRVVDIDEQLARQGVNGRGRRQGTLLVYVCLGRTSSNEDVETFRSGAQALRERVYTSNLATPIQST